VPLFRKKPVILKVFRKTSGTFQFHAIAQPANTPERAVSTAIAA